MSESQTDYDIQKICHLEARMRNTEARLSLLPTHPPKKIEPCQLTPIELKPEVPEMRDSFDSIDLKTNQKLKEITLFADQEKPTHPQECLKKENNNVKKIGSESRRFVKRKLDVDFDPLRKPKLLSYEEKGGSDNSNDGLNNFHHNNNNNGNFNNNSKITDYFEIKLNRKKSHETLGEKKLVDFKSVLPRKEKVEKNPIISMYAKKTLNEKKVNPEPEKNETENINNNIDNNDKNEALPDYINENLKLKEDIRKLNKKILDKDNQIKEESARFHELNQENRNLMENVKYYEDYLSKYSNKTKEVLCRILLESEKVKKQEFKAWLYTQRQRLGEYTSQRQGHKYVDVWIDGYELRNVKEKLFRIKAEKEELEKKKKNAKSKKNNVILPASKSLFPSNISGHFSDSENNYDSTNSINELTPSEQKTRISFQMAMLQRDELLLTEEYKRLEMEKIAYVHQYKRNYEEEKESACKLHQFNPLWSEHNREQYIRHAGRETQTHRTLNHPNIVKLYETFELDNTTLCTILEYCNGPDLSIYLKQNKSLPEKECKMIIKQILFGLKYLHENQRKIIHYDLKPQNILFHSGEIKITDFGLCKVIEDSSSTRLELTSQGVGTYWYLPPECFEIADPPPKISTKVDIWSVGVIFYEMFFGEKPFGNNMSQEKILKDQVILSVDGVKFPQKPAISNDGKEFIVNCLNKNPEKRWDVNQCLGSAYLSKK